MFKGGCVPWAPVISRPFFVARQPRGLHRHRVAGAQRGRCMHRITAPAAPDESGPDGCAAPRALRHRRCWGPPGSQPEDTGAGTTPTCPPAQTMRWITHGTAGTLVPPHQPR